MLDNGRQDVPLAAVLRSPLAHLPDAEDALARVRLAFPADGAGGEPVPFHAAVHAYAARAGTADGDALAAELRAVLDQLAEWRRLARDRPLAEVLWTVFDRTGYLAFCGGLPRGDQRQANLLQLHDRARQFDTFRRQGLGQFLRFLEKLAAESEMGQAAVAGEAEDLVRVVSIHKAKGLEYPVVIVPDLGKGFNAQEATRPVLLDRRYGLGLHVVDIDRQVRYPSLAWHAVSGRMRQQMMAEEVRVLYVAVTRAREHLILIGTAAESAAARWAQWAGHAGPFGAEMVLGAKSMLDWVGPAAVAAGPGAFEVTVHDAGDVLEWSQAQAGPEAASAGRSGRNDLEPLAPPPAMTAAAAAVVGRVGRAYPHHDQTLIEAVTSVSALAKGSASGEAAGRVLDGPAFLAAAGVSAVDRGTATHAVLERIDLAAATSAEAVRSAVAGMVSAGQLADAAAAAVDVDAIVWLTTASEVGDLLRGKSVRREVPIYFVEGDGDACPDHVMVRGRIDALVPEADGRWLIVDYKTDRVSGDGVADRAAAYAAQVGLYRRAVDRITSGRAGRTALVFLHARRVVWA